MKGKQSLPFTDFFILYEPLCFFITHFTRYVLLEIGKTNEHIFMFGGKWMKRLAHHWILLTIFLYAMFAFSLTVRAESVAENHAPFAKDAKAALLLEQDTGEILFQKNAHDRLPPASLTKVMTMLLTMEALEEGVIKEEELVTVSERAASMGGSQVFLSEGEQMTVKDLLKAVAIASANDASVALAERISGSEPAFVARMNEKAEELGLKNTKFQNASGLPAKEHYTTAYDIALVARELLRYDKITEYTNLYEDYLRKGEKNEFWLVNTNRLVRFYPYVDGLKTGYTKEAKYCLVATAKKDDMRLVSVIMGADSSKDRNRMTMDLLDYAFSQYTIDRIFAQGETVGQYTNLQSGNVNYEVKTKQGISLLRKKGEKSLDYDVEIKIDDRKSLPIEKGEPIGSIVVRTPENQQVETAIYADEQIDVASIFTLMKRSLKTIAKFES